jgi:hypothetical protein
MSGGALISYRKGLQPLQRYRVRFALAASDTSWNYMRFHFLRADGTVCATGYMKGAAVGRAGLVANDVSYARLGVAHAPAPLPEAVMHWLAAERRVVADA